VVDRRLTGAQAVAVLVGFAAVLALGRRGSGWCSPRRPGAGSCRRRRVEPHHTRTVYKGQRTTPATSRRTSLPIPQRTARDGPKIKLHLPAALTESAELAALDATIGCQHRLTGRLDRRAGGGIGANVARCIPSAVRRVGQLVPCPYPLATVGSGGAPETGEAPNTAVRGTASAQTRAKRCHTAGP
jgi:hypothetical protein